jgi:hypothetical protein
MNDRTNVTPYMVVSHHMVYQIAVHFKVSLLISFLRFVVFLQLEHRLVAKRSVRGSIWAFPACLPPGRKRLGWRSAATTTRPPPKHDTRCFRSANCSRETSLHPHVTPLLFLTTSCSNDSPPHRRCLHAPVELHPAPRLIPATPPSTWIQTPPPFIPPLLRSTRLLLSQR